MSARAAQRVAVLARGGGAVAILILAALPGCSSLLTPVGPTVPDDAALFDPATLAVQVGRTETLSLHLSQSAFDEADLGWGAGPGDIRVELACEPADACQVALSSRENQTERVVMTLRGVRRITMRVTGLAPGRESVRAFLLHSARCDFSFLGGCESATTVQRFAPIDVRS